MLRRCLAGLAAATARAAVPGAASPVSPGELPKWDGMPKALVSTRGAPSFTQPPMEEVVGRAVKDTPENWVTAYVLPEVISEAEERALLQFVNPWFDRLEYNTAHVDALIHHYKEFYRSYNDMMAKVGGPPELPGPEKNKGPCTVELTEAGQDADPALVRSALGKARRLARTYLPNIPVDDRVHFLRLAGSGFIRAHVDETRNSSGIIGGLCLNGGRVMTLTHPKYPTEKVELLLAPRCFYAIINRARYDWEHSVDWVADDEEHIKRINGSLVVEGTPVVFDGKETPLRRIDRTAVIFRGVSPMHLLAMRMQQRRGG